MKKKIEKLKIIYKEEGLQAALLYTLNFFIAKTGWFHDKPFLGRLIEKRGNMAYLGGCHFLLDSPLISRKIKSRFILGRYEKEERQAVRRFLDPSLPVIELGGSLGIVSCVTNKKLKNREQHVVVEANPDLIPLLEKNRELNNCSFKIEKKAIGYGAQDITFYIHERFLSGSAERKTEKSITVPTVSLANIFEKYHFEKSTLICDIEGTELDLVKNESTILAQKVSSIIIEVHPSIIGEDGIREVRKRLEVAGFEKIRTGVYSGIYSPVWVFKNKNP